MKTTIAITGQINSIHRILNSMRGNYEKSNGRFWSYKLSFKTKKDAVKALSECYQNLKNEGYWDKETDTYQRGYSLNYDAAKASIVDY